VKKIVAGAALALLLTVCAAAPALAGWVTGTVCAVNKYTGTPAVVGIRQADGIIAWGILPAGEENVYLAIALTAHATGANVSANVADGYWTAFKITP